VAEDGLLRLIWTERGGPRVLAPEQRGFGSRLIERGLMVDLGGAARLTFEEDGVVCEIVARLQPEEDGVVRRDRFATQA
jgi:two-component sensor histidine kinase